MPLICDFVSCVLNTPNATFAHVTLNSGSYFSDFMFALVVLVARVLPLSSLLRLFYRFLCFAHFFLGDIVSLRLWKINVFFCCSSKCRNRKIDIARWNGPLRNERTLITRSGAPMVTKIVNIKFIEKNTKRNAERRRKHSLVGKHIKHTHYK